MMNYLVNKSFNDLVFNYILPEKFTFPIVLFQYFFFSGNFSKHAYDDSPFFSLCVTNRQLTLRVLGEAATEWSCSGPYIPRD